MAESTPYNFILIDDNKLDCFIGEKVIQSIMAFSSINVYNDAKEALQFIESFSNAENEKTVILVDIQMPLMNGFEFIEAFEEKVNDEKQKDYAIYLLSSSINHNDIQKSETYKSVKGFLNKPLRKELLLKTLEQLIW